MPELADWLSDIERAVAALGTEPALGIARPVGAELSRATASAGFPGVLPLWIGRRHTVGLFADPATSPRTWSGVLLEDGEGITISSDARTLLPQSIVFQLSMSPDRVAPLTERWSELESRALALHGTLGGAGDALLTVVDVARDPVGRADFEISAHRKDRFEGACGSLLRQIDHSETFTRYANWLDAYIGGRFTLPKSRSEFGPWTRRAVCWAVRRAFADPTTPRIPDALVQWVIEERAGMDSGVSDEPSWSVRPGAASGETMLSEAAMLGGHDPPPPDAVSREMAEALLTEGASYRGLAHAEAVVTLAKREEPERAWGVLLSAAWWAARNTGEAPPAMLDGARLLADEHGWDDIRFVVDRAGGGRPA
jgi:hypothetical protein